MGKIAAKWLTDTSLSELKIIYQYSNLSHSVTFDKRDMSIETSDQKGNWHFKGEDIIYDGDCT